MHELESTDRSWLSKLARFTAILIFGLLIAFAVQNAIVGAVLPSLYSGSRLFKTGVWVLRADDDRVRGKVSFVFYLSAAWWMGSAAALATVLSFVAIKAVTGDDPDMDRFGATMVMLVVCVLISSALGVCASIAAVSKRIKIWINPRFQKTLELQAGGDISRHSPSELINYAVFVLATSIAFPVLAIGCLALVKPSVFGWTIMACAPIGVVIAYGLLSERIVASCPEEYWAVESIDNSQE